MVAMLLVASGVAAQNQAGWTDSTVRLALLSPSSGAGESMDSSVGPAAFEAAQPASEENDDLVAVALATFGVAVAAAVVGLVAYLVRVRLGLVAPPPPPPEKGHGTH